MAVVLAFRVGILVAPFVYRYAAMGGATYFGAWEKALQSVGARFIDPDEDPAALGADMSTAAGEGILIGVTDFATPFETRKLSVRWARSPTGLGVEDVAVIGVSFLKTPGGVPTDAWLTADYTTIETAFGALWSTLKPNHGSDWILSQYRWYADGPHFHPAPAEGNPARRVTDLSVPGTLGAGTSVLPPQCAESVTFKTAHRKHWGRIYWPATSVTNVAANGTLNNSPVDGLANAWVTFFNAARAASLTPVVFSKTASMAVTVDVIQVDDVVDIIRRRRWKRAEYVKQVALT